jgi:hypothetical protein
MSVLRRRESKQVRECMPIRIARKAIRVIRLISQACLLPFRHERVTSGLALIQESHRLLRYVQQLHP